MGGYFLTCLFFVVVLLLLAMVLGSRSTMVVAKQSPFECGFDPSESARVPFSLRFFLLAIVFLVFDVEVALLFPLIMGLRVGVVSSLLLSGVLFLLILVLGLLYEWYQGSLSWVVCQWFLLGFVI